ncbi:MAG: winged helix-turn-helix domain-containing protein [Chitinophagales bacterium]
MALINYEIAVRESELSLKEMERNEQRARFRDYIRFIRYLKTGEAKSQQESGSKIGLKSRQSQNLWSRYKKEGISGLLEERRKGSMGHLSYVQISHLQNFLRASIHPLTQIQIAAWLEASFGASYTQSGISDLFKRLRIKLKTGRPQNIRQKSLAVEDFKKTLLIR